MQKKLPHGHEMCRYGAAAGVWTRWSDKRNERFSEQSDSGRRAVVVVFIVSGWAAPLLLTWMTIPSTSRETPTFPEREEVVWDQPLERSLHPPPLALSPSRPGDKSENVSPPARTFLRRLFKMHSASKTCSPTALSSSMSAFTPNKKPLSKEKRRVLRGTVTRGQDRMLVVLPSK